MGTPAIGRYNGIMRQVLIYRDPQSTWWVAEVPSLPGCVSQGETREEALANIREAIDGWLEIAQERGWEILLNGRTQP